MIRRWSACALLLLALPALLGGCGRKADYATELEGMDAKGVVSWCVEISEEQPAEDWMLKVTRRPVLRSFDSEGGAMKEVALPDESYIVDFAPADAPGSVIMYAHEGMKQVFYEVDAGGGIQAAFSASGLEADSLLGWYGGKLYYASWKDNYYGEIEHGLQLKQYDPTTGEVRCYGRELERVFCVFPDGRAAALIQRDAGSKTLHRYRDKDGAVQTTEYKLKAWTLGCVGADGSWTPILDMGEDSEVEMVLGALWQDADTLLLAVCTAKSDACVLWRCVLSAGTVEPATDREGRALVLYVPYSLYGKSMQLSEDGKIIFYPTTEFINGVGLCKSLMAQSLETGARYRVYTDGAAPGEAGIAKEISYYACEYF